MVSFRNLKDISNTTFGYRYLLTGKFVVESVTKCVVHHLLLGLASPPPPLTAAAAANVKGQ